MSRVQLALRVSDLEASITFYSKRLGVEPAKRHARLCQLRRRAVEQICAAAHSVRRWVLLVGDHGNAEQMYQSAQGGVGEPYGGHTGNPVPCVLVPSGDERLITDQPLTLPSVGPTVLHLLGVPVPPTMSAPSLLAGESTGTVGRVLQTPASSRLG